MLRRRPPLALLLLAAVLPAPAPAADEAAALAAEDVRAVQELRRAGSFDEALAMLDAHPAVEAGSMTALALRGLVLLDSDREGAALVILARRFRASRVLDDAVTNTFVGRMRFRSGESRKAIARLDAALQYDPECAEARFLLDAARALAAGAPDAVLGLNGFDAKDELPHGLLDETVADLARRIGVERARAGASDDGTWALLQAALDHGGDDTDMQLVCARVLHRRGETEAAEALLDGVAKVAPHRMQDVLYERGLAQAERGEDAKAFETLDGALALGKDHTDMLTLAAELALDLDRLEDARKYLSILEARLFSLDVDRLHSRYCLERAERIPADDEKRRGNRIVLLKEAERWCISALKKDRFHVPSLERLARASRLLGEHSQVDPEKIDEQLRTALRVQEHRANEQPEERGE